MLDRVSHFLADVQLLLFPWLRQTFPGYQPYHEKVMHVLAMVQVERFVRVGTGRTGRPAKNRRQLARAFLAKAALNEVSTKKFRERLLCDTGLRVLCGWNVHVEVPSESTFSRAFAEFAETALPETGHEAIIKDAYKDELVENNSRDSTAIEAREKSKRPKSSSSRTAGGPRAKRGEGVCEKQKNSGESYEEMLEKIGCICDSGSKVSSKGTRYRWFGYKLHADVAYGDIPLACVLTSASVSDMRVAIPLSLKTESRATSLYELMDKGYDAKAIREFIGDRGRVAITQYCPKSKQAKEALVEELKARGELSWMPPEDKRLMNRTAVERVFSQLKDNYGGRNFRVRGGAKVQAHLMFGILALTAVQLIRLVC